MASPRPPAAPQPGEKGSGVTHRGSNAAVLDREKAVKGEPEKGIQARPSTAELGKGRCLGGRTSLGVLGEDLHTDTVELCTRAGQHFNLQDSCS